VSTSGVMRRRLARPQEPGAARLLGNKRRAYLFLAPAVAFFVVFIGFPIFSVLQASFAVHDTASRGTGPLANFSAVVHDPVFWTACKNMLLWGVLTITIQMVVGGTLAYLIETYARRSKAILRTAFLVPLVTSASVIAIVWEQIYAPEYGPLQDILGHLGINMSDSLLGGASTAIYAVIIINIWEFTGFSMLLYIVGLHRVPGEIKDAARVDGVSGRRYVTRILIPMLSPVTKSLVMLGIIGTLQTFPLVYLTTAGGPDHASEIFGTQIFRTGFILDQNGYAAALSVVTLLIAFGATVLQMGAFGTRLTVTGR
jgi:raffinose/stachyose/melibiose transport system permease protein